MTDSVSWVSFGLSALLLLEKILTKNKLKKCKCCGACIEFESQTPQHVRRKSSDKTQNNNTVEVKLDDIV
jgi:hypothetical protein